MPRLSPDSVPKYGKHKQSGQARVVLNGQHHLLGPHGTAASRQEYDRLVAEWIANGRRMPDVAGVLTISTLIHRFWEHAQAYYRAAVLGPDGKPQLDPAGKPVTAPTGEAENLNEALGPLRRLYGGEDVIRRGWSRTYTNRQVARIKQVFKWAAENELLPASVYHALETVAGLRNGRSEARESEVVKPVPQAHVDATLNHLSPQVQAMVRLQLLTDMRSSEVCRMRTGDIDTTGEMWVYRLTKHKTEHHGHEREIYLNKAAQAIVSPWLRPNLAEHLFSPQEAEAWRLEQLRKIRKTRVQPSQVQRSEIAKKRRRRKPPGERYNRETYRKAVVRASQKAAVPAWHPHQLRHNFGTRMRKAHGIEVARILLGHKSPAMTLVYAEADRQKAIEAMAGVG